MKSAMTTTAVTGLVCHECNKLYPTKESEAFCGSCHQLMTEIATLYVPHEVIPS